MILNLSLRIKVNPVFFSSSSKEKKEIFNVFIFFSKAICIAGELSVNIKDSSSYSRVIKELYDDEKYRYVVGVIVFAQEDSVR